MEDNDYTTGQWRNGNAPGCNPVVDISLGGSNPS